jgi:hypothetical protein
MSDDNYDGWEWVEALPRRIRRARFNGNFLDLPADVRVSGLVELNEFGWVVVHTLNGPSRLHVGDYLHVGTADEPYPVSPAISEYKYRSVDGPES